MKKLVPLCQHEGCKRPAEMAPKLCVPATGWPRGMAKPLSCLIGLACCRKHLKGIKVAEFLTDQMKTTIDGLTKGMQPPDYGRAWIEGVKLDSYEYLSFQRRRLEGQNSKIH